MKLAQFIVTMTTFTTAVNARCQCWECCGDLCGKVLFCLMFLLTVCGAINPNNTTDTEDICKTISPREAYFLEGEDIALTCSTPNISAENLTFLRWSNSAEVPQEFIHKLNDTAIKLIIPNVTSEDIDSIKESTPYRCANKHTKDCYDNVHLRLEYYPREPEQLDCRIYDFDEMTCTWSLGVDYHRPQDINVTCEIAQFMFKIDNPEASWAPCPDQNQTACHWNSKNYHAPLMIYTKVSVTAIERDITKETMKKFMQHDIMEPGPVKELKVSRAEGERCVELDWLPTNKYYSFKFNVTYSSACTPEKMKSVSYIAVRLENMKFNESRKLCGLTPYTEYTYTVKGRLMEQKERDNKTLVEKGYWSVTEVLKQRTDPDVLDMNPATSEGLYEIFNNNRPGRQTVQLYWTPLTDCDLHDNADKVLYIVTAYNETRPVKPVRHPAFKDQIDVPNSRIVTIMLQAVNSIGPAPSFKEVTIFPAKFGPSPSELIIQRTNKTDRECATMAEIVIKETQSNFSNISHTLVWCKGTPHVCQEPIKWEKLRTNTASFVLPGNLCNVDYRYGLVTHGYSKSQGQIVDTGIHWEPCIYQLGKVADKPLENVHLTDIQPSNGFSVEWNRYKCDKMKAYIIHYMVTYCVGHGSDVCKCTEDEVSVNVSRLSSSYTASDLTPDSQVCIWVRGISKTGRGPTNTNPLFYTIFAKSGGTTIVAIIVSISVFVAVLLVIVLIICLCKTYQRWKRDASRIRISSPEGVPLTGDYSHIDVSDDPDNLDSTLPGYYSPDGLDLSDRKYSVGDITEVLEGDSTQLTSIDSYTLAEKNSDQTCTDKLLTAENNDSKVPVSVSEGQSPVDISVDAENAGLKQKEEEVTERDGAIYLNRPDKMNENQRLVDKTVDAENGDLKQKEEEQLTMRDGAIYFDRPDKVKDEPDHLRHSISSLLSDAHTEHTDFSIEDLRFDQNSCEDQGLDLEAILSPLDHNCASKNKPSEETKDNKGVDSAVTFREDIDFIENANGKMSGIVHSSNKREPYDSSKCRTPEHAEERTGEISPSCHVGETEASEIENHSSVKNENGEQWNSADGFDFNETLCQLGDNYKQLPDIDSQETNSDQWKSGLSANGDKIHTENIAKTDDVHEQEVKNHDTNQSSSDSNQNKDKELDFHGMNENVTDQIGQASLKNEGIIKANSSDDTVEVDEQNINRAAKLSLSNNLNGLVSGDSKHRTSGSSDNSGNLQSYVTADNDTFKEPNSDLSDVGISNAKLENKHKTPMQNGNINGTEQLHNTTK